MGEFGLQSLLFERDSNAVPCKVEKTVKDVVQTLVADGLVQSDKIGSSNCERLYCFSHRVLIVIHSLLGFSFCQGGNGNSTIMSIIWSLTSPHGLIRYTPNIILPSLNSDFALFGDRGELTDTFAAARTSNCIGRVRGTSGRACQTQERTVCLWTM